MRTLHAMTYGTPHWTGLTRGAMALAEAQAAAGQPTEVHCVRHEPTLPAIQSIGGVTIHRHSPQGRFSRGFFSLGFVQKTLSALRPERIDRAVFHTPLPELPIFALACRRRGIPYAVFHHGDLRFPPGAGPFARAMEWAGKALWLSSTSRAKAVFAANADYLEHGEWPSALPSEFKHEISYILRLPEPASPTELARFFNQRALPLDGPRIGIAGRWVHEKGFDLLLKAWPRILESYPRAQLFYAGEAPAYERFDLECRPLLEPLIAGNRYHALGRIDDRAEMSAFYSSLDVFVQPSRSDLQGLVQLEAAACGIPLVVTDIPGARAWVRESGCGVIVRPEDPAALAEGIGKVLRDPSPFRPDPKRTRDRFSAQRALAALKGAGF